MNRHLNRSISLAQVVSIYVLLRHGVISWSASIYMGLISKGIEGKSGKSAMPFRSVLRGVEGGSSLGVGLGIDWGHRGF